MTASRNNPAPPHTSGTLGRRGWLLVGLLALVLFLGYLARQAQLQDLRAQAAREAQTLEQLRRQQAALEAEVSLAQEPPYIEGIARDELGMSRPGDQVYSQTDDSDTLVETPTAGQQTDPGPTPFFSLEWWRNLLRR